FIDTMGDPERVPQTPPGGTGGSASIPSLEGLVVALPAAGTQRLEALKSALGKLARSLGAVKEAAALRPLADPESSPLRTLGEALERIGQLTASALRRCGGEDEPIAVLPASPYPLTAALGRALTAGADVSASLQPMLATTLERAFASMPRALA